MDAERIDEHGDQCPYLFRIPSPISSPRYVCPYCADEDSGSQVQPAHHLPLYHNKITNYTFCIELTTTKRAYIGIKYTGNPQDAPSINPSNTFRWTSDSPSNVWPYANEWMPNDIQYWNSADTLMKMRTNDNDISNYIIKQLVFVRDNHLLDI